MPPISARLAVPSTGAPGQQRLPHLLRPLRVVAAPRDGWLLDGLTTMLDA